MMVVGRMAIGTQALGMGAFGVEAFGIEAFGRMALGMEGGGKRDTSPNLCLLTHNQLTTKQARTMRILRSHSVMTPRANYLETSVFVTIATIIAQFTGIYAHKPQQTPAFIALTLI